MKRITALLIAISFLFAIVSCDPGTGTGSDTSGTNGSDSNTVVGDNENTVVLYVDSQFTGSASNGSQEYPFLSIGDALNAVETDTTAVYVAEGIYNVTEAVELIEGISLYGGYDGSGDNRSYCARGLCHQGTERRHRLLWGGCLCEIRNPTHSI